MRSLIEAFQACQIRPRATHGNVSRTIATGKPRLTTGLLLTLGLIGLPFGVGCRTGSPPDWGGERVAMTNAWQGQSSQVHREDASFQEGWRSGFQDGRAQASIPAPERKPAEFEAFMNSQREEAKFSWRRGYDSGIAAASALDRRQQDPAESFPTAPAIQGNMDAPRTTQGSTRDEQHRSLFGVPENQGATLSPQNSLGPNESQLAPPFPSDLTSLPTQPTLPRLPTISESAATSTLPSVTTESRSPAPNDFDNANELLDSAIRRGMAHVNPTGDSATIDSAPESSKPAVPAGSESDVTPNTTPKIIELPPDDDDVAKASESQNPAGVGSVFDDATNATSSPKTVESASEIPSISQLQFGQVPHAYEVRIQFAHVVNNPHVSPTDSAPKTLELSEQSPSTAPVPISLNSFVPVSETSSEGVGSTVRIASDAPDSPSLQVKYESLPDVSRPSPTINHLPKGLHRFRSGEKPVGDYRAVR